MNKIKYVILEPLERFANIDVSMVSLIAYASVIIEYQAMIGSLKGYNQNRNCVIFLKARITP